MDSVEPFNEPSAAWWKAQGTQEGCHFDGSTQAAVIPYLRVELGRRGLTNTVVAASDETSYSSALTTWNQLPGTVRSQVGQVNVHGSEYGSGPRSALAQATVGKRLWNSEYGEGDASGLSLAQNLGLDLALLRPSAWCYWQPFDYGGWGLIQADPSTLWIGPINSKYQVFAHYTRHIRPGQSLLETSDASVVAAYDEAARRLVLVTVNPRAAQTISYDFSGWFSIGGPARSWTTVTGEAIRYRFDGSEVLPSGTKSLTRLFPAGSIKTIEIDQVDRLAPPPNLAIRRSSSPNRLILEWPKGAGSLTLQTQRDLVGTGSWISVSNNPIKAGTNWAVTVNAPMNGPAYFRLIIP